VKLESTNSPPAIIARRVLVAKLKRLADKFSALTKVSYYIFLDSFGLWLGIEQPKLMTRPGGIVAF